MLKRLVTNYREGGYKTGGVGWACEVLPLLKGGGCVWKKFNHAEGGGGHSKFWGSIYTVA